MSNPLTMKLEQYTSRSEAERRRLDKVGRRAADLV